MRTTIRLEPRLLREAKAYAARTGTTFTALITQALQAWLGRRQPAQPRRPVALPTFAGRGLQPGVDLDDTAALVDLMDAGDAPG